MFRTVVFDALEALEGKRDCCFLSEWTRPRPVLLNLTPPSRPYVRAAVCPDQLALCTFLDSIGTK